MKGLILSLPRSRSSWLSFVLGYTHEYVSSDGDIKDLPDDVGCVEINPFIDYPECPTVCIIRDPYEVAESLSYFAGEMGIKDIEKGCVKFYNKLLEVTREREALPIMFDDIDKSRGAIEAHLGIQINKDRWDFMCKYRIEPMLEDLTEIFDNVS